MNKARVLGGSAKPIMAVLLLALFSSLLLPIQSAGAVSRYVDVPKGSYYADAVDWSVAANITGITGDYFAPAQPSSRGETAVWIWRMVGQQTAPAQPFGDVPAWQSDAVAWLLDRGVTTGTSPTTFSPSRTLTRGELAAFLWRLAGEPAAVAHSFNDVVKAWQQNAVSWLATSGITTGTSQTTFSPDRTLSRADLITFLYRYNNLRGGSAAVGGGNAGNAVTVPPQAPIGNCSSELSKGIYNWERCAWFDFRENPDYHKALSNEQANELIQRIWEEVHVEGKPGEAPTSALVPAGSSCASATGTGFIIGCYTPGEHHIRRLDSYNDTLLHEVAHALVSGHPTVSSCVTVSNDAYQTCVHGDIFRCVADYLYVRYAGIPTAGVCGTASDDASDAAVWVKRRSSGGALYAYTDADWHTREYPYEDDWASLVVRCSSDSVLDVYLSFGSGYLSGSNDRISVSHEFYPAEYWDWDEQTQDAYTDEHTVVGRWFGSGDNKGAFMPSALIGRFVESALIHDFVYLSVEQFDDTEFGAFNFNLSGADQHITAVVDECGGTPPPWNEFRNDNNELGVYVEATWHNRAFPYDDTVPTLRAVCKRNGDVDIFLDLESGYLVGQYLLDGRIPVTYVFFPYGWDSWDQQRLQTYSDEHSVVAYWDEATSNEQAFLPYRLNESFVNSAINPGELLMIVDDYSGDEFGRFLFDMHGLSEPLSAVTEECGWAWNGDQSTAPPADVSDAWDSFGSVSNKTDEWQMVYAATTTGTKGLWLVCTEARPAPFVWVSTLNQSYRAEEIIAESGLYILALDGFLRRTLVEYRIDDGPLQTDTWFKIKKANTPSYSTEIFKFSPRDSAAFLNQIRDATQLVFWKDGDDGPGMEINVTGLDEAEHNCRNNIALSDGVFS